MGTCRCDWLLVINVPGDTIWQILFTVAVQQLEFHRRVAKICRHQADDGFIALTLIVLGKNPHLHHCETMGSTPNDNNLQTHCEFRCFAHYLGWWLASARHCSLHWRQGSRTDGSTRGVVNLAGGGIHPHS